MKGSLWIVSIVLFGTSIGVFSSGYGSLIAYLKIPTVIGLLNIAFHFFGLIAVLMFLGFIMYATERRSGNIKIKSVFFERILGYTTDSLLPNKATFNQKSSRQHKEIQQFNSGEVD